MFDKIKKIFKKNKSKLYFIELDDGQLNKEITNIILHMEKEIEQFRRTINETTWETKDKELILLFKEMTNIKQDVNKIKKDINKIVNMKLENMKYFIIKDDSFLSDKKKDLEEIQNSITSFLEIVEQRPSKNALKQNLISELLKQLTNIQNLTNKIVADDMNLQIIYRKINQI